MAAPTSVVLLDRGNNTTCTVNLHGKSKEFHSVRIPHRFVPTRHFFIHRPTDGRKWEIPSQRPSDILLSRLSSVHSSERIAPIERVFGWLRYKSELCRQKVRASSATASIFTPCPCTGPLSLSLSYSLACFFINSPPFAMKNSGWIRAGFRTGLPRPAPAAPPAAEGGTGWWREGGGGGGGKGRVSGTRSRTSLRAL